MSLTIEQHMRLVAERYAATEPHRHACEVRHVCSLPTSRHRHLYINGLPGPTRQESVLGVRQRRGDAEADRLLADARALWETGWRPGGPLPPAGQEGAGQGSDAASGERTSMVPGLGSFPAPPHAGPLRRDERVVSGVAPQ